MHLKLILKNALHDVPHLIILWGLVNCNTINYHISIDI